MRYWVVSLAMVGVLLWPGKHAGAQARQQGSEKILLQSCQGPAAVLDVTSERMTFDRQTRTFTFEEGVRVQQCGMTILCDRLHVTNDTEGENVERIIALGNVRFQQGTRHVVAERAEYHAAEQRLVLTGKPRAWDTQEHHEMTGEEIIIFLQQENVVVKHARVLFRPRKQPLKEP